MVRPTRTPLERVTMALGMLRQVDVELWWLADSGVLDGTSTALQFATICESIANAEAGLEALERSLTDELSRGN